MQRWQRTAIAVEITPSPRSSRRVAASACSVPSGLRGVDVVYMSGPPVRDGVGWVGHPPPVTWAMADMNGTARKMSPGTRVATVTGTHTSCDRRSITSRRSRCAAALMDRAS